MIVEVLSLWSLAIVPATHPFYRIDDYISLALRCFLYLNFEYFFFLYFLCRNTAHAIGLYSL